MPFTRINFKNELVEYPENLETFVGNFEIGFNKMVSTMIPALPADTLPWGSVLRNELAIPIMNIEDGTTSIEGFVESLHTALTSKGAAMALAITNLGTFTGSPPVAIIDLRNEINVENVSDAYDIVIDLIVVWLQTGLATNNTTGVVINWN